MTQEPGSTCTTAMECFHRLLDGDLMDAADRQRMDNHLTVCSECSEKAVQLREMQDLLRGMAEQPMPEPVLSEVRARTVDAQPESASRGWFDWRLAAAAASIVLLTWVGITMRPGNDVDPMLTAQAAQQEEAERAAQEVRMVLQLTANALKKTEQVAFREVFAEEISPALRKVGVTWPQAPRGAAGDEG